MALFIIAEFTVFGALWSAGILFLGSRDSGNVAAPSGLLVFAVLGFGEGHYWADLMVLILNSDLVGAGIGLFGVLWVPG